MLGYLLSDDLIFTSRVCGTASSLGLYVKSASSVQQLATLLAAQVPKCLLVDLHHPGLSIDQLLGSLAEPRPFVVGYGSHVDAARLKGARNAGCDEVLPRSKFVDELATSLPGWLGSGKASEG